MKIKQHSPWCTILNHHYYEKWHWKNCEEKQDVGSEAVWFEVWMKAFHSIPSRKKIANIVRNIRFKMLSCFFFQITLWKFVAKYLLASNWINAKWMKATETKKLTHGCKIPRMVCEWAKERPCSWPFTLHTNNEFVRQKPKRTLHYDHIVVVEYVWMSVFWVYGERVPTKSKINARLFHFVTFFSFS